MTKAADSSSSHMVAVGVGVVEDQQEDLTNSLSFRDEGATWSGRDLPFILDGDAALRGRREEWSSRDV